MSQLVQLIPYGLNLHLVVRGGTLADAPLADEQRSTICWKEAIAIDNSNSSIGVGNNNRHYDNRQQQ